MLYIDKIKASDLPVSVEVDPYVPIAVRTFSAPIGAVFYRVGNFDTSLVELPIDPISGAVRGIKVVCLDRVGTAIDETALSEVHGLPITAKESIPQKRQDDQRDVAATLIGDRLLIDWSGGQKLDTKAVHGRLSFFIGDGSLLAAAVESLTSEERQSLLPHMPST
ncbi:hypothetical protein SAMN02745166_05172 [Prosthecobacter debontii]|uniref:Uncharacterized protein n=1 Tax=Prosthecobacter debontii TaxID=48467 RepID=A0A1T4Z726_9BACT|nr:hypothetical protein [Prosthecobacter debontii]SKB09673.1 hypothetical protein SAMN02745166_05172 [Prosthecobacter debontii]